MEAAATAGKGRVSAGKRRLPRASTRARYLLQDPLLQEAVDRHWRRVSRNGIIEGIAFKQMYKVICAPLFPGMPTARLEQLAHEKWVAFSENGVMEREGFIDFISELAEAVASQRGAAMVGRDAKVALESALDLVRSFDNTVSLQSARIPVAGDTVKMTGEQNRRPLCVRDHASLVGVVQATDASECLLRIQAFARRPALLPAPGCSWAGHGTQPRHHAEGAGRLVEASDADHASTVHKDAGNDGPKPVEAARRAGILLKSQSLRIVASSDGTSDAGVLAKRRRARCKQPAMASSLLQRSQTDPTLGGLHPVGVSSADRHHQRPASCSWETVMPKKQPVRLASGRQANWALIRTGGEEPAGQSVADDLPFEEWVGMALPAHRKSSGDVRVGGPCASSQISLPCCICRKHASLWCDDCAAVFCNSCWPGMPDHDVADLRVV